MSHSATRTRPSLAAPDIALPPRSESLTQDEEWVVVRTEEGWKQIRLHDYGDVYAVPGLYETWIYDVFRCRSPRKIRDLLNAALEADDDLEASDLTVLDLGAGNGCVAEELEEIGIGSFVGVDIHDEAAEAAERDRPGLYDEYVVGDLTDLPREKAERLDRHDFNCMTCVAALGFGDIPPAVFIEAFNRVEDGGLVAFTIKNDFVDEADETGFAHLVCRLMDDGLLRILSREQYAHRVNAKGESIRYVAYVGRKEGDLPVLKSQAG